MKTIVVTFNVPKHLADAAQEYAEEALQVLGGMYTPEHSYYHVRKSIENINAYVGAKPPKLLLKNAIIGQRCIVRPADTKIDPYIGILTSIRPDRLSYKVRHAVSRIEYTCAPEEIALLPLQ